MPIVDVVAYYKSLFDASTKVLSSIESDPESLSALTSSYNGISDLNKLYETISLRPESEMFLFGIKEYQFGLYALTSGMRRHAYASLRLSLELMLCSVLFSANELKYRKWSRGEQDIVWAAITDADEGVFSKVFVRSFHPGLEESAKQHATVAAATYRDLSEHVHGNKKTHGGADLNIEFQRTEFMKWHELADTVRFVVSFAYAARFAALLDAGQRQSVRDILIEELGTLPPIQSMFGQ